VQALDKGYVYGCGTSSSLLDQSTVRAGVISLGASGVWRYWGLAPDGVTSVELVQANGAHLTAPISGNVFGVDTAEHIVGLKWTDQAGTIHDGSVSVPAAPPS
jgi:hypothetical protein